MDVPYDDTWDRSGDVKRRVFQKQITGDLLTRKIPFFRLSGNVNARIQAVKKILKNFQKYQSLVKNIER